MFLQAEATHMCARYTPNRSYIKNKCWKCWITGIIYLSTDYKCSGNDQHFPQSERHIIQTVYIQHELRRRHQMSEN